MNSVLERSDGNLPVILCPKTGIKRPVAACICLCEKKDVNFCQQIKRVAIEELDLVADDLPETNQNTWQSRRDFFLTTALGDRVQHDSYDESVNGGGGLQSAEDLGINLDSATSEEETHDIPTHDETDPLPDDGAEPVATDEDFPTGPYPVDEENDDAEPGDDQDGDDGDKTASVNDDDDGMASLAHEAAANAESSDDPSDPEGGGSDMAKKKCPHCDEKFDTDRGRNIHIGRKHPDEEKPTTPKKKTAKKSAASSSGSPKPPSGKGKKGIGQFIIVGDDNQYRIASDQEEISGLVATLQEEQDEGGEVHIYEIAREVKIETKVTIVDV